VDYSGQKDALPGMAGATENARSPFDTDFYPD
jgi:hypothetical protein